MTSDCNGRGFRLAIVAVLAIAAAVCVGCEDETQWQHPNRERNPAPPEEDDESASVEELEERWARQDAAGEEREPDEEARMPTVVDVAAARVLEAFSYAMASFLTPGEVPEADQPREDDVPVGGGPEESSGDDGDGDDDTDESDDDEDDGAM